MARISVIGSGVVGTAVGKGFKKLGNDVIFYDIEKNRVDQLRSKGFDATTDMEYAVKNSDITFVSVPTPTVDGKIDLSHVLSATKALALTLKTKDQYHVVVIKSTVVPTTTENIVKSIIEEVSGKKCGIHFGLCMNPEFLTETHRSWSDDASMSKDFFTDDRIVIGEFDKKSGKVLEELYRPLNIPVFRVDLKTAELIKYASNCCLASRISYWNEIFLICNKLGVDSNLVARIVSMDKRIGKYGAVHQKAFGGKCFPKDLRAFISFVEDLNHEPKFLKATEEVNEMVKRKYGVRE